MAYAIICPTASSSIKRFPELKRRKVDRPPSPRREDDVNEEPVPVNPKDSEALDDYDESEEEESEENYSVEDNDADEEVDFRSVRLLDVVEDKL